MNSTHSVILVLPHIKGNSTSIERFKSFIAAIKKNYQSVKIICFEFPQTGNSFLEVDAPTANKNDIEFIYKDHLLLIKPNLNIIQTMFFKLSKFCNRKYVKPLLWVHQIIYGVDIFSPTRMPQVNFSSYHKKGIVIAFGGPFGLFEIAKKIAKQLNFKFILDYRDPWTFGYAPVGGSKLVHQLKTIFKRSSEQSLLKQATLVSTVSATLKQIFPVKYHSKIFVLSNGCNFNIPNLVINNCPLFFNIVYTGTIYDVQLKDLTFFKAMQKFMVNKNTSSINLFFLGSINNKQLPLILKQYNLSIISTITKRLNKNEILPYFLNASCFLHLKYKDNKHIITSKQADYLAFKKPILLPISDFGDIADSIVLNDAGEVCYSVSDNLNFLNTLWQKHINNQSLMLTNSKYEIETREMVANKFVSLISKL